MFWRKKQPSEVQGKEEEKPKEDHRHPREIVRERIIEEVENLAPGETLTYKLPEFYHSGFAAFLSIELNPSYPEKGKKYHLITDKIADGKPAGQKTLSAEVNNSLDAARWISVRDGQYGSVTRFQ